MQGRTGKAGVLFYVLRGWNLDSAVEGCMFPVRRL